MYSLLILLGVLPLGGYNYNTLGENVMDAKNAGRKCLFLTARRYASAI